MSCSIHLIKSKPLKITGSWALALGHSHLHYHIDHAHASEYGLLAIDNHI